MIIYIVVFVIVFFFFFQAEDGIRDAQESRGLGDVYKRQRLRSAIVFVLHGLIIRRQGPRNQFALACRRVDDVTPALAGVFVHWRFPVSYTHLTLPTIYPV